MTEEFKISVNIELTEQSKRLLERLENIANKLERNNIVIPAEIQINSDIDVQ